MEEKRFFQNTYYHFTDEQKANLIATFDISIFEHGSEAFGSKLQIFQVPFVPQFPKETKIQRKQHQI